MKNIHVLPTDKPSRLIINWEKDLCYKSKPYLMEGTQDIYITNDEEIKEGDWFIRDGSIHKCFKVHKTDVEFLTSIDSVYCGSNTFWSKEFCKKIILTTDPSLAPDVQKISDEFLEWFVKNPSCEEVEIERFYSMSQSSYSGIEYKIIIPRKEIKLEDVFNDEKKEGVKKLIHKVKSIPAEEILDNRCNAYEFLDFDKQERMYSEEDMREAYKYGKIYDMTSFEEWFEQFKNK